MIRALTRRAVDRMRQRYDYDAAYLNDVAAHSSGSALRLGLLPLFTQYDAHLTPSLWAGAALGSTLDGDCGPCVQLVIDTALERGVSGQALQAALAGDWGQAGEVGLGMQFARAAIADTPLLSSLREDVRREFGDAALANLSIVAATARAWPVIKRGLGHGEACQRLVVEGVAMPTASAQ